MIYGNDIEAWYTCLGFCVGVGIIKGVSKYFDTPLNHFSDSKTSVAVLTVLCSAIASKGEASAYDFLAIHDIDAAREPI